MTLLSQVALPMVGYDNDGLSRRCGSPISEGLDTLNYAYLAATLAVGALLYWRRPGLYIGFTWWLWFLTPEVRRLLDYVQGWNPINPVMLAPYLVSALAFFTLVHHLPKLQLNRYFPFVLIFSGVFYAYAVGVYRAGVFSSTYQLVEWSVPVAFAFYLVVHWRKYPVYRQAVQRTFVWAVLLMGVYGLIQFFYLPPWDRYWMLMTPIKTVGSPEPMELRVFSTMNSQTPFADVMMAGLLLLLGGGGLLRWPAATAGYTSFFLSLVRQAWGGWLIGLLFIIAHRGRSRPGLLVTLAITALMVLPLLNVGPVADRINERLETIANIGQDTSFRARVEFYEEFLPQALLNPVGEGLGSTGLGTKLSAEKLGELGENASFDSGVLELPYLFGWLGTTLYVSGLAWLLYYALRSRRSEDLFAVASLGVVVGILVQLPFNDKTDGLPGMLLWSFIGLAIAAESYRGQVLRDRRNEAVPGVRRQERHRKSGNLARREGVAEGME
jgi:hypothetical protein